MSNSSETRIWLSPPHMSGREQEYIQEAFAQNWIAPLGPNVTQFEKELSAFTHTRAAAALSSGTAAIHLALIALGVQRGDIVLCQSFTFAASAFPVQYVGAEPVFIDSEPLTWNMDPHLLELALQEYQQQGRKVAAILLVHLYGMPAQMDALFSIAANYRVPVIEDAAEALGSTYQVQPCGSFGKVGILSFNGNKIITTSGGGALISQDIDLVEQVRFLSTQAKEPYPWYEHRAIGFNYRMSNIVAGIGRGQMTVLEERVHQRRRIHDIYAEELSDIPGLSFLMEPEGSYSNRWLTTLLIDEALTGRKPEQIRMRLEEHNIESRPLWKPLHSQPVFAAARAFTNGISERLFQQGLCLPSGSALTDEQLRRICQLIKTLLNE
jgi:dTDP-4-amino-4,6-dideoxygalactose transaminase